LVTVVDLHFLGWGVECKAWEWRMRLFAWEKDQVGELSLLVTYIVLHEVKQDI